MYIKSVSGQPCRFIELFNRIDSACIRPVGCRCTSPLLLVLSRRPAVLRHIEGLDERVGPRIVGRALADHAGVLSARTSGADLARVATTVLVPYGARAVNGVRWDPVFIEHQMWPFKCGKVLTGAIFEDDPRVEWLCLPQRFARRDGVVKSAQIGRISMPTNQDWHRLIRVGWVPVAIVVEMNEDVPVLVVIHVQV